MCGCKGFSTGLLDQALGLNPQTVQTEFDTRITAEPNGFLSVEETQDASTPNLLIRNYVVSENNIGRWENLENGAFGIAVGVFAAPTYPMRSRLEKNYTATQVGSPQTKLGSIVRIQGSWGTVASIFPLNKHFATLPEAHRPRRRLRVVGALFDVEQDFTVINTFTCVVQIDPDGKMTLLRRDLPELVGGILLVELNTTITTEEAF